MNSVAEIMKKLWRGWKGVVHRINDVIAFVLMSFTYIFALMPVALIFKIFTRDLIDRGFGDPRAESYWKDVKKEEGSSDIRRVQRQY